MLLMELLERNELITDELETRLKEDLILSHLDKLFQVIIKCAMFEFLYKPKTSSKIIIKEYLSASNFFFRRFTNQVFKCFIR